jgi:hypothetical protein
MPREKHHATVTDLDALPGRLTAAHMQAIFGFSPSGFWAQVKVGTFTRFELWPPVGERRWSKFKVKRYLEQEERRGR